MAIRIQKYQEQIGYETTNLPEVPHIQAVEGAFGGDVARGTQAIGKAVGDVAQVLQKHAVEQRQLQNDAFVASIDSEHTKAMQDALSDPTPETTIINGQKVTRPKGYLGRSGLNSIGSLGDFEKWHDTKAKSILDNIKDPATRLRVAKNIDSQYLSARGKVMEHEARETRSGYIKELESNRDLKISSTFNVSDVGKSLDEIAVLQNKINNAQGLDGATSQVELRKAVGSFVKNMVDTTLQADPTGDSSRALLANLSGRLGDDDNVQMNKYIDGEVKKNATVLLDDLNSKFIDGTITLEDIQSANRPKEKGGIGSASAMKMLKDLTKAQAEKLDSFRSDSAIAENYIQSVEAILFGQDSYKAKQILVDAFADGTMDREEAQKINRIKGILDRQKLTRDNDIRTNIPIIKNWFAANDSDKRELANTLSNYLTALDEGKAPEEARDEVLKAQYNKTYPQAPLGKDDKLNDPARERQFVTMSPAERFGRGFGQGVAGTVEGFGGALRWLKQEELGKAVSDYAQTMKKFYAIPDPKFIDQISAGFGSMATFFIPGMGITKGVQAVTFFPRFATWLGVGASTALEATVEAGNTYEQALQKGMPVKDAENAASKTFWVNIPTLAITNKLGVFGESGNAIVRSIKASGFEGFQEFSQSVISNIALHDDTFKGAFESAVVGAIVGGGTKMSVEAGSALKEMAQAKEAMVKFDEKQQGTGLDSSERGSVINPFNQDNSQQKPIDIKPEKSDNIEGMELPDNLKPSLKPEPRDISNDADSSPKGYQYDLGAIPGEPMWVKPSGAYITTIEVDGKGSLYQAVDKNGNLIGNYEYLDKAVKAVDYLDSLSSKTDPNNPLNYKTAEEYVATKKPIISIIGTYEAEASLIGPRYSVDNKYSIWTSDDRFKDKRFDSPEEARVFLNKFGFEMSENPSNLSGDYSLIHKPTLDIIKNGVNSRNKIDSVFVRYGKPPSSGFSKNYRDNIIEPGISVFNADLLDDGSVVIKKNHQYELGSEVFLDASRNDDLYIVTGDKVGVGSDGEPVLKNVKLVRKAKKNKLPKQISESQLTAEWEAAQKANKKLDKQLEVLSENAIRGEGADVSDVEKAVELTRKQNPNPTEVENVFWDNLSKVVEGESLESEQKKKGSLSNERGSVVLPFPEVTIPEIATPKSLAKAGKDFNQFADAAMVPLSTRLGRINESLRDALRKFEFNNGLSMHEDLNKALPFMEHMADMPETESAALDLALKNADRQTIEEIVNRNGIRQEYEDVRELLDGLYNRAKEVGLDVKYLDDYFPRRVDNPEEFLNYLRNNENWSAIDKAIKQEETKIGSRLNNEERVEFINKLLRGYGNSQIRISKPSNIKSRKIQIIDEQMNAFYKNSTTTLQEYIVAMNKAIEAKKFFGMNGKDIENSIGSYVKDLVDSGMINHTQEREVADILKARFSERGTHGIWSFYKNLGYLYTMSSPISAITQIGDLSFALYENGFYSTAKGLGKAFSKNKITKQDLGIDVISDEFSDQSKSGEAVTKVFKLIGLEAFDNIGKETLINGAMDKLSRQARENNPKLTAELERVFGDEAQQTLQDLINQEPSVNVKYLLFSRLAKYQPIALSEMPEYYSKGGNLRIFYMLKSYTVKQIDAFNNEVFSQMQSNPKQAIKNLVGLSLALMTLNAGADVIKDVLLGRPTKASDLLVDNILRLFGFSKYTIYKAKREGLGEATMKTILPPIPFVDDLYKDIAKGENLSDYKLWNSIPFVGKFYYWWFGGGREYLDKKKRKRSKTRSDF